MTPAPKAEPRTAPDTDRSPKPAKSGIGRADRTRMGRRGTIRPRLYGTCLSAAIIVLGASVAHAGAVRLRTSYTSTGAWSGASSLAAVLGYQNRKSGAGNLRLMWKGSAGAFRFVLHSRLAFLQGDDVAYKTALAPFMPVPLPATLFDLNRTWQSNANTNVSNRIDRLSVSYSSANLVLKLGRQAITWGSGMVFHPADIVAPFAPNAIDTTYKPGVDMVYGQYLFASGADIQVIAIPRRPSLGAPVSFSASTYAVRGHTTLGSLDSNLMLARDRGDTVGTIGLSGALGGASWNAEYIHWALGDGSSAPSWLFNISNFSTLGGHNISYFGEIYHNGFGVGGNVPLSSLPAALGKRMATGQVFVAGRDFLSLGARFEVNADISISPNAVISLNDHSALAGVSINYALGDNTNILFSYRQPIGATGTEFGGRETTTGSGIFATPAHQATLQLVRYF